MGSGRQSCSGRCPQRPHLAHTNRGSVQKALLYRWSAPCSLNCLQARSFVAFFSSLSLSSFPIPDSVLFFTLQHSQAVTKSQKKCWGKKNSKRASNEKAKWKEKAGFQRTVNKNQMSFLITPTLFSMCINPSSLDFSESLYQVDVRKEKLDD